MDKNKVKITMEDGGEIVVVLDEKNAPLSVENFRALVERRFYDGLIFHRVIDGFMIQGGDPTGTGCGGSEKNIKGEFYANGVKNNLSHRRGVISMARANDLIRRQVNFSSATRTRPFLTGNTPPSALRKADLMSWTGLPPCLRTQTTVRKRNRK